jgi:hypothetical protein
MFFPWVGLFEQIRLADVYVHYDDVQLPQGRSFITRVQLKGPNGVHWMTMPVRRASHLPNINATDANDEQNWRQSHLKTLHHLYGKASHASEMLDMVESIYSVATSNVAELNGIAIERIADYFDLPCQFQKSSEMPVNGKSTDRLLGIVKQLKGNIYITGHGARHYLDHELFEESGIHVEYMKYNQTEYKQLHGAFTPFVSILDVIANEGKGGRRLIASSSIPWKEFLT